MKNSILSLAFVFTSVSAIYAQCVNSINVSTGWDQSTSTFIPNGSLDDDWILSQKPAGSTANVGQPATIIQTFMGWDLAGGTSKYINFHNSQQGPTNWCAADLPFVYENPFCVCGTGEDPVNVIFNLNLNCDNWSEVWLLDNQGTAIQMLITQPPFNVTSNFQNPPHNANVTIALLPGKYSLALLQKNGGRETGVTLDGTISASEGGTVAYGSDCNAGTNLSGNFLGSNSTTCTPGGGGGGGSCPSSLVASTGYNQTNSTLIADNTPDDEWIVTQLSNGINLATGGLSYVIPKHAAYDWAGNTSKYINYNNSGNGVNNWSISQKPIVYQYPFCICGHLNDEIDITFDLDLHADNWAEVWLMDGNNDRVQLLLSQNYAQVVQNFRNPTDHTSITVTVKAGQYSLALLQRNGGGASAVSLEALISTNVDGILGGTQCGFIPTFSSPFYGSTFDDEEEEEEHAFELRKRDASGDNITLSPFYYPNPASNSIFLNGFDQKINVTLTDIQGKVVLNKKVNNNEELDISGISSGVYMLIASDAFGNNLREKLIVE